MGQPMKAGLSALQQASAAVEQRYEDMVRELGLLQQDVANVSSGWQGGAHNVFADAMEVIDTNARKMAVTLQSMGQMIKQNMTQYHGGDQQLVDSIKKAGDGAHTFSLGGSAFTSA